MKFNKQKIFNKATRHLLKQYKKAVNPYTGTCSYRTEDGLSCALGCLIPDSDYSKSIEGRAIFGSILSIDGEKIEAVKTDTLRTTVEKVTGAKTLADFRFLGELQHAHDRSYPAAWRDTLKRLADKHGLKFPRVVAKKEVST